jgi:hypothetical protein
MLVYRHRGHYNDACSKNRVCNFCANKQIAIKRKTNIQYILGQSCAQTKFYGNEMNRQKTSLLVKKAMHRPDVRKKHIDALFASKWLKVKCDVGQLELLEKWNKLGFNFEPNYSIKTENDLFYVDGYDRRNGTVLEFDTKYHFGLQQKTKDLLRQQKIISVLKPKRFWRFNSVDRMWSNIV